MQYFNVNNTVHALDDGINPSDYIKEPFTRITKAEADAMLAPAAPTPQQQRDAIQAQIDTLESATKMNRAVREMMLLLAEEKGAALGLTPAQLYLANPAYKAVKDVDNQVTALRTQKDAIV